MSVIEREGRYLIELMRSVLTDEQLQSDESEHNWNLVCDLAKSHSLAALLHDALIKNNIVLPEELNAKLHEDYCKAFVREGIFQHEYECIVEEFGKSNVDMIPLKGYIMKNYYPYPWHRSMSDMDILIRPQDCETAKNCMNRMGYTVAHYGSGCDDAYFKEPVVNIEIHHALFNDTYESWNAFFKNMEIRKADDGTFRMTDEDTYLYMLTHTAKHLKNGGVGIRQVLDLWLYWNNTELNESYIQSAMHELKVSKLHSTVQQLARYWMTVPHEYNELMDGLTTFFVGNGVYGKPDNQAMNRVERTQGRSLGQKKLKIIMSKFFPSMKDLKNTYPVLNRFPIMLPVIHIQRALRFISGKGGRKYLKSVKNLEEDKVQEFHSYMQELFEE